MRDFTFCNPTKVYFGHEAVEQALAAEMPAMGDTVMIAYGGGSVKRTGLFDRIVAALEGAGKRVVEFGGIMPNPTYAKAQEGAQLVRDEGVDFILAVGGGSTIDCCKVVSAQARLDEDLWAFEHAGGAPSEFVPMGAIVTVSGTGAEMNPGAVITNEDVTVKGPLWGAQARFAVLEPDITLTVPPRQVISGAFDTLSHCMETYFGVPGENNLSDAMNEAIMTQVIRHMRTLVHENMDDYEARSELMWASAMAENSILKIGKVTDFQAHQIEHQLGAHTDCNHGCGLAAIHPALYRHLAPANPAKFARFATVVWGIPKADDAGNPKSDEALAAEGIDALAAFIAEMGLPTTLTEMGITDREMLRCVADTSNTTAGCCKKLDADEIYAILLESL